MGLLYLYLLYYFTIQKYAFVYSSTLYQNEYGYIQTCTKTRALHFLCITWAFNCQMIKRTQPVDSNIQAYCMTC